MHNRYATLITMILALSTVIFSPASQAAVPLKKGQSILSARNALIAQGWAPRVTYAKVGNRKQFEHSWGDAGLMFKAGLIEVEGCAGTGANPCAFNYKNKRQQCLRIITLGEFNAGKYAPTIDSWSSDCPPADALQ